MNFGLAQAPRSHVAVDLASGALIELLNDTPHPPRPYRCSIHAAARAFVGSIDAGPHRARHSQV
ncbi:MULTISPECIES: hypothetical protein [unclassified Bradyrhizobium]|jgi:DNA-binding transcriptional LysR family regulator|uniref:hypothetical protein n=1 Tax=unclassified Bradyrhizobium TaxID=2631580 RepID=UPI00104F3AE4|nr:MULTISPECIES: hypothetical protein [unclassified Bradyrhizobium]